MPLWKNSIKYVRMCYYDETAVEYAFAFTWFEVGGVTEESLRAMLDEYEIKRME